LSWGLLILTTLLLSNSAEAKVKFKIVEEIHIHKIFGLDAKLIEDNLEEADFNTKGVLYSILGMHPTDSDSLKEPGIIYLDECIRDLKKLKERNKGLKYLGFKLVDGFFISESDQFEWNKENPAEYIEISSDLSTGTKNRFTRFLETSKSISAE